MKSPDSELLFNSAMETGLRAIIVLDACFRNPLDLTYLCWLDHLVVHTSDIGGPESLHPDIPQRKGELLVRRHLIEDGLNMMRKLHLVDVVGNETGFSYFVTEQATAFVDCLHSEYAINLKDRAEWLSSLLKTNNYDLSKVVDDKVGRWVIEFQSENSMSGNNL